MTQADTPPEGPPVMIHRLLGATTTQVRWWDRVAYALSLLLLVTVAFYQGKLDSRISDIERTYKERVALTEQRFQEDHSLLMAINAAKEQRTAILDSLDIRINRLERGLPAGPMGRPPR